MGKLVELTLYRLEVWTRELCDTSEILQTTSKICNSR